MATGTLISLEDFQRLYASQDKAYEYWFGEPRPKSMPTTLHGILQKIVANLLEDQGYFTGTEIDLHIDLSWQPRPDVIASSQKLKRPYPTRPENLFVVEILSPDDRMPDVHEKCENYERIGIAPVFILHPESRKGWVWSTEQQNTERVTILQLPGGTVLDLNKVWQRLDEQI